MYAFGPFRLDTRLRRLLRGDEPVPVTIKAFDTLAILVEQAGRIVTKEDLMRRVWPDAIVEEANLSQQIFLLRKVLGEGPKDPQYIQTVPRRGYRFIAAVTEQPMGDAAPGPAPIRRPADQPRAASRPLRLSLVLPSGASLALGASSPIALSPDGATLAYVGRDASGRALYLRALDRDDPARVPRSDDAESPFFSPDSRWVGFIARGRLWKALASGGSPIPICDAGAECRGACWTTRDEIVFAPTPASGLVVVPAEGGVARAATKLNFDAGERTHRWPDALPDGGHVLFTAARAGSASFDEARIVVASLDTGDACVLVGHGTAARYVASGHLVYMRGGSMMAVRFDAERRATSGAAIPVVDGVMTSPTGSGFFALSEDGCLAYLTGDTYDVSRRLVWIQDGGRIEPAGIDEQAIEEPRLSPDGRRAAFGIRGKTNDVWVYDFESATLTRMTFEGDNFRADLVARRQRDRVQLEPRWSVPHLQRRRPAA